MIINIDEKLNRERISPFQLRVVVLCTLVALLDGIDVQMMSILAPVIAPEWGVDRSSFALILSAGLAGLMIGTMGGGLLGDRIGRRPLLIWSFLLVGGATVASGLAQSQDQLMLCRLMTGLGMGGCLPNATALAAEYVPARNRSFYVTVLFSAGCIGGVIAGVIAPMIMGVWGWRGTFVAAGAAPLIVSLALIAWLPESLALLGRNKNAAAKVGAILEKAAAPYAFQPGHQFHVPIAPGSAGLRGLLAQSGVASTLVLWTVFFFNLFGLYLLTSWLPSVMVGEGWSVAAASRTLACFFVGGFFGGLVAGWLSDRTNPYLVLIGGFVLNAALTVVIGLIGGSHAQLLIVVGLAGFAAIGSQTGTIALAAGLYPTEIRASGVGWALGIGRLGAVVSPLMAGAALSAHGPRSALFFAAAFPALACAIGVCALWALQRRGHAILPIDQVEAGGRAQKVASRGSRQDHA